MALDALDALAPADRALFYAHGIGPARAIPFPIVHHAFQAQARAHPHLTAVEHYTPTHTDAITYAALDAASDRLAHALRAISIVPGTRVAILARRSVALAVAVLAALKAGAQYVPLDARTITDDTLAFVLADAQPRAVLAMDEYVPRVRPMETPTMSVLSVEKELERMQSDMPDHQLSKVDDLSSPEDGAYCIYTSGTTGRPKGVDVRHIGIANVLSSPPANMHLAPGTRIASLLNIAFDMGAWELLSAFINGATLCLRGSTQADWRRVLASVDVVIATPTILSRHDPRDYPALKRVVVGGEVCPVALAHKWASCRPTLLFHNCCGPTEISICNTVTPPLPPVPSHSPPEEKVPIGAPIGNTSVYILREEEVYADKDDGQERPERKTRLVPVPIGDVGSMWVGGVGVSGGYLNLPDKTRERWRRDPFIGSPSYLGWSWSGHSKHHDQEEDIDEWAKTPRGGWARPMMFNTGDLGRWRPDGQLEHLGRADDQVKVSGFRVELDGVGASLRAHSEVHTSTALLIDGALWGFVTPNTPQHHPERLSPPSPQSPAPAEETTHASEPDGTEQDTGALLAAIRAAAARTQPPYAVPRLEHMVVLRAFPVTRNGKVDKRALREIAVARGEARVRDEVRVETVQETRVETNANLDSKMGHHAQSATTTRAPRHQHQRTKSGAQFVLEESLKMVRVDLALVQ